MSQVSKDKELHENKECDPLYCPFCEKIAIRARDWDEGKADFRLHEKIDDEGEDHD
jgi:hypothetical protein